jgi:hypothetical protein
MSKDFSTNHNLRRGYETFDSSPSKILQPDGVISKTNTISSKIDQNGSSKIWLKQTPNTERSTYKKSFDRSELIAKKLLEEDSIENDSDPSTIINFFNETPLLLGGISEVISIHTKRNGNLKKNQEMRWGLEKKMTMKTPGIVESMVDPIPE